MPYTAETRRAQGPLPAAHVAAIPEDRRRDPAAESHDRRRASVRNCFVTTAQLRRRATDGGCGLKDAW